MDLTFMSPHDEKQILRWSGDHPAEVAVRLVKTADEELREAADEAMAKIRERTEGAKRGGG